MTPIPGWRTLDSKRVLDHSRWLRVENRRVALPDGREIADWPWVVTPDYVNVMVETEGDQFVFFRQTKYALDGMSLAPVGGYLEPGEEPLTAARREVREETGFEAREWIGLGRYVVDANRGVATAHLYLAREARRAAAPSGGDLEEQTLMVLSRQETEAALRAGQFQVLAWATVVALALRRLDQLDQESVAP